MKRLLAVMLCLAMLTCIGAACADTDPEISPEAAKVEAFGIPSREDIAELKAEADELWEEKDYSGAAEAYAELADQAGWMAEIAMAVNAPYDTSSDADAASAGEMKERVAKAEALAVEYLEIEKLAAVRAGLSYYRDDDYENALPFLMKALYLMDVSDTENWILCAEAVLVIIGETEVPEAE